MVDPDRRPDRDTRWWMYCQPHIRALREVMYSANANKEVEILLQKCVSLYMATINYNSSLDDEKIYIALTGGFVTSMEASFMWIGGWRPTTALLLVYSLMGVQLEDEIRNFGYGIRDTTNTSAVLSHRQLENLTNVQKSTRNVEKKLSKKLAHLQVDHSTSTLSPQCPVRLGLAVFIEWLQAISCRLGFGNGNGNENEKTSIGTGLWHWYLVL